MHWDVDGEKQASVKRNSQVRLVKNFLDMVRRMRENEGAFKMMPGMTGELVQAFSCR